MSTTTTPYSAKMALQAAQVAAELKLGELQDALEHEHDEAVRLAEDYAAHLAADGDPTLYPQPGDRDRLSHGLARVAREAVFDTWNDARERQSVSYPWGQSMPYRWIVQESLLDRLGQPVPMAELAQLGRRGKESPLRKPSALVAEAAWSLQVATGGAVRVRKVKADGKVAWLARLPFDGDDLADLGHREGVWGSSVERLSDAEVQAALARPFKSRVFEYPTEVL